MHKKYGRKENIRKQNFVIEVESKRKNIAYFSIVAFVIINSLFLIFFTWTFFEKELHINLIPFLLAISNSVLIKYMMDGFLKNSKSLLYAFISFFLFLFLFTVIKDQIRDYELKFYSKKVNALIYRKEWHDSRRGSDYWIVSAQFNVYNKTYYTFFTKDEDEIFKIGDTTQLIYSIRNPEISKLIDLEE